MWSVAPAAADAAADGGGVAPVLLTDGAPADGTSADGTPAVGQLAHSLGLPVAVVQLSSVDPRCWAAGLHARCSCWGCLSCCCVAAWLRCGAAAQLRWCARGG
eukprot:716502-Pelagomonas_calceolata.AAC.1